MPQATAKDYADYVRSRVPELADQSDGDLVAYLFHKHPEFQQDTKAASGAEINRMQAQSGDYTLGAGLKSFFSQGLSNISSIGKGIYNQLTTVSAPGYVPPDQMQAIQKDPSAALQQQVGGLAKPFTAPVAAAQSKTPAEFGRNMADVMTTTVPAIYAGGAALRGLPPRVAEDPTALMERAQAIRDAYKPVKSLTDVAKAVDVTKPLSAVDAVVNLTRPSRAARLEARARALAGPPSPASLNYPESDFEPQGPTITPSAPAFAAGDEAKRSLQWARTTAESGGAPTGATPTPPGVPQHIQDALDQMRAAHVPEFDTRTGGPPQPVDFNAPAPWRSTMPGPPGSGIISKDPIGPGITTATSTSTLAGSTPKSPFYAQVLEGMSEDTLKLQGRAKLNNIARDAQSIMKEQGFNAIDKIDQAVGGDGTRKLLLSMPNGEGQEAVAQLVSAWKRADPSAASHWQARLISIIARIKK